jgi:hypothetical protein
MSEYQYYEFQAIDRPLTPEEQEKVSRLSSRTEATAYNAAFVYNYSDFPADEEELLAKYFDAMLHLANWGTSRLLFRFPRSIIDEEVLRPYCYDSVKVWTQGDYVIFDMSVYDEEPYGWVEGEGRLSPMLELRQDILNGDFRAPYLAWLKIVSMDAGYVEDVEGLIEPPVPANLAKRSRALDSFIDFFYLDEDLVGAAAEASSTSRQSEIDPERWIHQLPEAVKDDFLIRLANGEPGLHLALKKHLLKTAGISTTQIPSKGTRTVSELLERADAVEQQRIEKARREAELKRNRQLDKLAERVPQMWERVFSLIEERRSKSYEQAVELLVDLRDLARRDGWEAEFQGRIDEIGQTYSTLRALRRCMENKGLSPR